MSKTKAKHTPGPWRTATCTRDAPRKTTVHDGSPGGRYQHTVLASCHGGNAEANAALIAAAPDMKAALEAIKPHADALTFHEDDNVSDAGAVIAGHIRTALAKAESGGGA
jgi:hypothetical protein